MEGNYGLIGYHKVDIIQAENPSLKTTIPFMDLNEEYCDFYERIGKEEAIRYFRDPIFRQEIDNSGLGLSQNVIENLNTYRIILDKLKGF